MFAKTDAPFADAQIEIPPGTQSTSAFLTRRNQAGGVAVGMWLVLGSCHEIDRLT